IALEALRSAERRASRARRWTGDHRDATTAALDQVTRGRERATRGIDEERAHTRNAIVALDGNDGHQRARFDERSNRFFGNAVADDDQTDDLSLHQRAKIGLAKVEPVIGVAEGKGATRRAHGVTQTAHDLREERVREIRDDHAHRMAFTPLEPARE